VKRDLNKRHGEETYISSKRVLEKKPRKETITFVRRRIYVKRDLDKTPREETSLAQHIYRSLFTYISLLTYSAL